MADCIFCLIAAHQAEASIVYEDADVVAFMDGCPIRTGHVLVIPRAHGGDVLDLDPALYSKVFAAARTVGRAIRSAFNPKRVGFVVAGFDVPHAHVHVIPMAEYHDITSRAMLEGTLIEPPRSELEKAAAQIQHALETST